MKKKFSTSEQVEKEIARLLESPEVKLAKKDLTIRNKRRQYMYKLRGLEKRGKELAEAGVTMESLEELEAEIKNAE